MPLLSVLAVVLVGMPLLSVLVMVCWNVVAQCSSGGLLECRCSVF